MYRIAIITASDKGARGERVDVSGQVIRELCQEFATVTSYAVAVKEKVLGVPAVTVERFGVVSSEVAAAMAEGVRALTGSTYSVSTTGLAEGGDGRYPEGTVWIGACGPAGTRTRIYHCDLGRKGNIRRFARVALEFLEEYILESSK